MWLFYVIFVAACSGSFVAYAQEDQFPTGGDSFGVDGFVFDGPADRPTNTRGSTTARPPTTSTSTSTSARPMTDAQFDACVAACPSTPEYNPVCGTDNGDYENPGRLSCAAACGGTDLAVKYFGRCMTAKIRG